MNVIAIEQQDHNDLQNAKYLLENPGLIAKATNLIGKHIEEGFKALPADWSSKIGDVTEQALRKAADAALFTMKDIPSEKPSNIWHKLGVAASGALGGALGLPALAVELPISTTLMLRSILDIARGEGESISSEDTKVACLEVFALGSSRNKADDDSENGYYAIRAALAMAVTEATQVLAKNAGKVLTRESSSALLRFLAVIAERFSITVTEKAAVQAVPVIGAIGGATINTLFMDHYQDMAKGHFTVRRLERKYGKDSIQTLYTALPSLQNALPTPEDSKLIEASTETQTDNQMKESYDLTTAEGWKSAIATVRNVPVLGLLYAPNLWLADKIVDAVSPGRAVEKQAQAAVDLIKAGKESGAKKMKITMEEQAGLHFDAPLEGVKISMSVGSKGKATIDVEYI